MPFIGLAVIAFQHCGEEGDVAVGEIALYVAIRNPADEISSCSFCFHVVVRLESVLQVGRQKAWDGGGSLPQFIWRIRCFFFARFGNATKLRRFAKKDDRH